MSEHLDKARATLAAAKEELLHPDREHAHVKVSSYYLELLIISGAQANLAQAAALETISETLAAIAETLRVAFDSPIKVATHKAGWQGAPR